MMVKTPDFFTRYKSLMARLHDAHGMDDMEAILAAIDSAIALERRLCRERCRPEIELGTSAADAAKLFNKC